MCSNGCCNLLRPGCFDQGKSFIAILKYTFDLSVLLQLNSDTIRIQQSARKLKPSMTLLYIHFWWTWWRLEFDIHSQLPILQVIKYSYPQLPDWWDSLQSKINSPFQWSLLISIGNGQQKVKNSWCSSQRLSMDGCIAKTWPEPATSPIWNVKKRSLRGHIGINRRIQILHVDLNDHE